MFKKKAKKDTLINKEEFNIGGPYINPSQEEKKSEEIQSILQESKKIKKKPLKGVEANPKTLASPPREEKNQNGMTGLLDKEFFETEWAGEYCRQEPHLSENLLGDSFGGKFTRTKAPEQKQSLLQSLESELGHVFKINDITKAMIDEAKDQTQWTSGMMEVQVGFDRKVKNIEASEAARQGKTIEEPAKEKKRYVHIDENDKEYRKTVKNFEKAFRKEGRKFMRDQMMRKIESSAHEDSQVDNQ